MSRATLNLVLLAVVAGLGLAIWQSQEKAEKGPPLTALDPETISAIEVIHPDTPRIALEKRDGEWFLTEPVEVAADKFEVNGILALADLELQTRFEEGVELGALELSPPVYTVRLDQTEIRLGGKEPIKHRRYVAVDDIVGLISDPPSAALDADYSDLVSRHVLPRDADIREIQLPGFRLRRDDNGQWHSPEHPQASARQLSALAEAWRDDARALWNAALENEPEGARSSDERVRIVMDDGREILLSIESRDPQLVLASAALGVRYTLSKALEKTLLALPASEEAQEASATDTEARDEDHSEQAPGQEG